MGCRGCAAPCSFVQASLIRAERIWACRLTMLVGHADGFDALITRCACRWTMLESMHTSPNVHAAHMYGRAYAYMGCVRMGEHIYVHALHAHTCFGLSAGGYMSSDQEAVLVRVALLRCNLSKLKPADAKARAHECVCVCACIDMRMHGCVRARWHVDAQTSARALECAEQRGFVMCSLPFSHL